MASIRVTGLKKLQRALKENVTMADVKRVVRHNGQQMHQKIVDNAEFKKGYQTGTTKRNVAGSSEDGGFAYEAEPTTEYSQYLEYGTRFMDAQPFVRPAYAEQKEKFKKDIQKLVR